MPQAADIGSKRLISLAPDAWVQWVMQRPDVVVREIVSSEFQWVSRESDVLIRAHSLQDGEFLVLNELQLRYTSRMPRRMRAYTGLAEEKYNLSVYPVLVNIFPPASTVTIPNFYEAEFLGLRARQDYCVINLWEVDAEIALQGGLPALIPFVPALRGGGEEAAVRRAVQLLRADERLNVLENLLAFFASFVLEIPLVQQIMRWDMAVLQESPWYREILQQGRQEGLQQGAQRHLLRILQYRFGIVPLEVQDSLQGLSSERLEQLLDLALRAGSLDEFVHGLVLESSSG